MDQMMHAGSNTDHRSDLKVACTKYVGLIMALMNKPIPGVHEQCQCISRITHSVFLLIHSYVYNSILAIVHWVNFDIKIEYLHHAYNARLQATFVVLGFKTLQM